MIEIKSKIFIPEDELVFKFSLSSGQEQTKILLAVI